MYAQREEKVQKPLAPVARRGESFKAPEVAQPVSIKRRVGMPVYVDPRRVRVDVENPRRENNPKISDTELENVVRCMAVSGQVRSGQVHPLGSPDGRYDAVLMSGELELRACLQLGLMFRTEVHSVALGRKVYVEEMRKHVRTVPHTLLQRTAVVSKLVSDFGMSAREIADMFLVGRSSIHLCFDVFKLAPNVREMFAEQERDGVSVLSSGLLGALCGLSHAEQQKLVVHIVSTGLGRNRATRYVTDYRNDVRQEKAREIGLLERLLM